MVKTLSFALIHMCVAFSVGFVMTGDVWVGGALAIVEPLCNTVAYYFHELAWSNKLNYKHNDNVEGQQLAINDA